MSYSTITCPYEKCGHTFQANADTVNNRIDRGHSLTCCYCAGTITWHGGKSKVELALEEERKRCAALQRQLTSERTDLIRTHAELDRLAVDRRSCPLCGKRTQRRAPARVQEWMEAHLVQGHNATPDEIKLLTA